MTLSDARWKDWYGRSHPHMERICIRLPYHECNSRNLLGEFCPLGLFLGYA